MLDAGDFSDLVAQLGVEHAGELLPDAFLLDDDVDFLALVDRQEGLLEAAGDADQSYHGADGHGHADHGQARADAAADHVFQDEGVESHADFPGAKYRLNPIVPGGGGRVNGRVRWKVGGLRRFRDQGGKSTHLRASFPNPVVGTD